MPPALGISGAQAFPVFCPTQAKIGACRRPSNELANFAARLRRSNHFVSPPSGLHIVAESVPRPDGLGYRCVAPSALEGTVEIGLVSVLPAGTSKIRFTFVLHRATLKA
jgi:hypothetical protein